MQHLRGTRSDVGRAGLGLVMALSGALVLGWILYVTYGTSAFCRGMAVSLGLALPLVISCAGEGLILTGAWLLWSAARGRRAA